MRFFFLLLFFSSMRTKKSIISGEEGYRELLKIFEYDGKQLEFLTIEKLEKLEKILENDLFDLNIIQTISRECIVNISVNDSNLLIRTNQRLEILFELIKYESFVFIEYAENFRGLIDLNIISKKGIDCQIQSLWKNELLEMQSEISSNQMEIINYYKNRHEIGLNIFKQGSINNHLEQLIEIDEEIFYTLRMIVLNLRKFYFKFYNIVYQWIHSFENSQF